MIRRVTLIGNFHTRLPCFFLLGWVTFGLHQLQAEVLYNRDVRPLLSANCFKCHGPDDDQRKADLRLDIPGEIDFEEVLRRISSENPDERMPPPESNQHQDPLLPEQIQTLQNGSHLDRCTNSIGLSSNHVSKQYKRESIPSTSGLIPHLPKGKFHL